MCVSIRSHPIFTMNVQSDTLRGLGLLILILGLGEGLRAQSYLTLGQYTELLPYYNASAIAATDALHLRAVHNRQWEGVDGASKSFLLMADMPLRFLRQTHGIGVQMSNDAFGLFVDTELSARYAFRMKLGTGRLHIGLGVHFVTSRFEGSKIYIPEGIDGMSSTDVSLPTTDVSGQGIDASVGLFYQHPRWWVGLSTGQLLAPTILLDNKYQRERTRAYTLVAGYNYQTAHSLFLWTPSLMAQIDDLQMYRLEGRMGVWYREKFHLAAMYRHASAVGVALGIKLGQAYLGYQYELPTTELRAASWGSHEIMVSYSMPIHLEGKRATKYKSIRLL